MFYLRLSASWHFAIPPLWIQSHIISMLCRTGWTSLSIVSSVGVPNKFLKCSYHCFSFLQGFFHNFPDAPALRLVIVLTIFQALVGSTALNALSTSPIWYLIGCYSRFLYTACKSLLASILVTASGLLSSCGCEIPLLVFRFSFAGRLFLHCSSV